MPFSNTTEEHILSKTNYKVFMIPYEKELTEYFSSKDSVILAYLFGSTVRGDAGRLSDVDIGVLLNEKYYIKRHTEETLKRIAEVGFT